LQLSKIEVPLRFKQWIGGKYPDRAADAEKWETWDQVPNNSGLREEWWREEKEKLPVEI
jgi:hypothetical protein